MPVLSGICSAFKCSFFGFYVNGITLADGMVESCNLLTRVL